MGEFSTMQPTRLSCCSRLDERDRTQGLSQAREGAQGRGLSRNSKEVRDGGREVMACLSKLERLLLDRSRKASLGRELKDDPGQRIEARWVWVTVSLVRVGGRWEVERQVSLPFEIDNSLNPFNPLSSSVVLRPEQDRRWEVQEQGRFEGREGQELLFWGEGRTGMSGEERPGRSANRRGSNTILKI